jgi:hypothetical protein
MEIVRNCQTNLNGLAVMLSLVGQLPIGRNALMSGLSIKEL